MEYDIFISYSRSDSRIVDSFVQRLESAGYKVWIDRAGVYSGSQFKSIIVQAIENSRVFLFFSSKDSNASPWTAKEIAIAVDRHKTIIPVKLDAARYNPEVEFDLINLDFVDYCNLTSRDRELNKLMRTLEMYFSKKQSHQPQPQPQSQPIQQTYRPAQVQKSGTAQLSFFQKNRGCVITLTVLSSVLLVCVPLFLLTRMLFFTSSGLTSPTESEPEIVMSDAAFPSEPYEDGSDVSDQPQLVDLGLPSGTLWMDRNLGASLPEDSGMYLAWGETQEKDEYSEETYFHRDNYGEARAVKNEISGTEYDAAAVLLGPDYCIPTKEQMKELITSCSWKFKEENGKEGYVVTGPSGESIFLPACGFIEILSKERPTAYWTSTIHDISPWILVFSSYDRYTLEHYISLEHGLPIRPVSKK